jgi:hypothetical protein
MPAFLLARETRAKAIRCLGVFLMHQQILEVSMLTEITTNALVRVPRTNQFFMFFIGS